MLLAWFGRHLRALLRRSRVLTTGASTQASVPRPIHAAPTRSDIDAMRAQLTQMLDRHPASRSVLRYLAALERALRRQHVLAFELVPVEVLQAARHQLELLLPADPPMELVQLSFSLVAAVIERSAGEAPPGDSMRSRFFGEERLSVEEVNMSRFVEADGAWDTAAVLGTRDAGAS